MNPRERERYKDLMTDFRVYTGLKPDPSLYEDPTEADFIQYSPEIVHYALNADPYQSPPSRARFHVAAQRRQTFLQARAAGKIDQPLRHATVRADVWDKTDGRCWYCGILTNPWRTFCIDHVRPQATEKDNDFANLVPCCRRCNVRKGPRDLETFRSIVFKAKRGKRVNDRRFWFERQAFAGDGGAA